MRIKTLLVGALALVAPIVRAEQAQEPLVAEGEGTYRYEVSSILREG